MLARTRVTAGAIRHFAAVVAAITHPPEVYIEIAHNVNTLVHLTLLALWLTASFTVGFPAAPVEVYVQRNTYDDTGKPIISVYGNKVAPIAWLVVIGLLLWCDVSRLRSTVFRVVPKHDNRIDVRWHTTMLMVVPIMMGLVLPIVGDYTDTLIWMYVMSFLHFSVLLSYVAEELQALIVSTEAPPGPHDTRRDLIWVIVYLHSITMYIAALSIVSAVLKNSYPVVTGIGQTPAGPYMVQTVIAVLAILFLCAIAVLEICNHLLYNRLHRLRPDRCNIMPFSPQDRHDPKNALAVPLLDSSYTSSFGYRIEEPTKPHIVIPTALDMSTTETHFDKHWVSHVHGPSPIPNPEMNISIFEATDEEFELARRQVGLLVQWRRYYVLSPMINMLLIATLYEMTGIWL
jgi:hypothetical protein